MTHSESPKKSAGFNKALKPSPELAAVTGTEPIPRTEVTKRLWAYIKERDLQNPANKRNILCDDKLTAIMGKSEVTMFEITSLVGKHLSDV
jgi:chromatin remodeling complex protein RSC6